VVPTVVPTAGATADRRAGRVLPIATDLTAPLAKAG
jgi:hypothetical protein